jgi:hypothetical protein
MSNRTASFIMIATIAFGLVSFLSYQKISNTAERHHFESDQSNVDRNENSTPRSFVRPATPAVADEQERKLRELKDEPEKLACVHRMQSMGFNLDVSDGAFEVELAEALMKYQATAGIAKSGVLDNETRSRLGC